MEPSPPLRIQILHLWHHHKYHFPLFVPGCVGRIRWPRCVRSLTLEFETPFSFHSSLAFSKTSDIRENAIRLSKINVSFCYAWLGQRLCCLCPCIKSLEKILDHLQTWWNCKRRPENENVIIAVFEERKRRKRKNQSESLPRFHHYYASPACLLCVSAEVGTTLEVCISFASPNFCASHTITSASEHELCSNNTANCIHRAIVPLISRLEWFWISWNSNCIRISAMNSGSE